MIIHTRTDERTLAGWRLKKVLWVLYFALNWLHTFKKIWLSKILKLSHGIFTIYPKLQEVWERIWMESKDNFGSTDLETFELNRTSWKEVQNFQPKYSNGKCACHFVIPHRHLGIMNRSELVLASFGKLFFLVHGKWPNRTELTIRHFCLPFVQTVDEPVSPGK